MLREKLPSAPMEPVPAAGGIAKVTQYIDRSVREGLVKERLVDDPVRPSTRST